MAGVTGTTSSNRASAIRGLPSPGAAFGARYRILRELGAGGMGVVYQAWDDEVGVAVALKVIRPEVTADPYVARDVERRFKRELLLARQVTHTNVLRIHDLGQVDGIKYISMPFVDGRDLAAVLRESGGLPVARALRIAVQIAAGLQAAHRAGVVHRDLKPENVMLEADDSALIMDFGISRSAETGGTMTAHGAVVGTLEYMAPEQGRALQVDHRADIYSFGLILRDMLVGRGRLAARESPIAEMMARMTDPPPPMRTEHPAVPEALDAVVSRCIDPDPGKRFQTTEELVAALAALDAEGCAITAPPGVRVIEPRLVVAGAAVLILLMLSAAAVVWRTSRPASEAPTARAPMSVLVADFQNDTNEAVFEGALEQALATAMEGAPFISAYQRRDARQIAAGPMKLGPALDAETATLVARREDIRIVLAGSIAREGSRYQLSVRALNGDGDAVAEHSEYAQSEDHVLAAVSAVAARIRQDLGDTESVSAMPAETFTAGTLKAMNAYDRAQVLSRAGRNDEALAAYREAIAHDPEFGRAYAGMAVVYGNIRQHAEARESYDRAVKLIDRMSERERLRTLGAYYLQVTRNYEEAVETYESLVQKYPADNAGHANLAIAYLQVRNLKGAMEEGRKAIDIYPRNLVQRTNHAMYAMYAGDFAKAIEEAETVLKELPGFDYALLTLGRAKIGAGDIDGARAVYQRLEAAGASGVSMARLAQADLAMYEGQYRVAIPLLERGVTADRAAGAAQDAATKLVALAEAQLAIGNRDAAAKAANDAIGSSAHESIVFPAGMVLIETGRREEGLEAAARLDQQLQGHTTAYAELLRGLALFREDRIGEALAQFRSAKDRHDSWYGRLLLGQAYLAAPGLHVEALDELRTALARRGEAADAFIADTATFRYLPPVYYWLARAEEATGSSGARARYEEFLRLREHADSADPLVADVRQRLATTSAAPTRTLPATPRERVH